MVDIKFIREHADEVKKAAQDRGLNIDIDQLLKVDSARVNCLRQIEDMKAEQNKLSKTKPDDATIERLKGVKKHIAELEQELGRVQEEYMDLMVKVPTIPSKDVPLGKSDKDNIEVVTWGEPPKFDFEPKSHVELAENLDLIDFQRGAKVSG